jgi:hypothetical protein
MATHRLGSHIRCHFYHNQIVKERRSATPQKGYTRCQFDRGRARPTAHTARQARPLSNCTVKLPPRRRTTKYNRPLFGCQRAKCPISTIAPFFFRRRPPLGCSQSSRASELYRTSPPWQATGNRHASRLHERSHGSRRPGESRVTRPVRLVLRARLPTINATAVHTPVVHCTARWSLVFPPPRGVFRPWH